jgi:hypothetical protein
VGLIDEKPKSQKSRAIVPLRNLKGSKNPTIIFFIWCTASYLLRNIHLYNFHTDLLWWDGRFKTERGREEQGSPAAHQNPPIWKHSEIKSKRFKNRTNQVRWWCVKFCFGRPVIPCSALHEGVNCVFPVYWALTAVAVGLSAAGALKGIVLRFLKLIFFIKRLPQGHWYIP